MPEADRTKWNAKYAAADPAPDAPAATLKTVAHLLPQSGAALDVAGGAGRNAIWLAARGLDVTIADISAEGLAIARQRAQAAGVHLDTIETDVVVQPPPPGPWDVVMCVYYLNRDFLQSCAEIIRPGGLLIVLHPTVTNLQRREKPPAAFLLDDNELPQLVPGMQIVHHTEAWRGDNRYEALLAATKPQS